MKKDGNFVKIWNNFFFAIDREKNMTNIRKINLEFLVYFMNYKAIFIFDYQQY